MSSKISTAGLIKKCQRFITSDFADKTLEYLIREAVIQADRDLHNCDSLHPLAWDIVPYDELRCNIAAEISAITQANPGVITAASYDSDVAGHGFHNHATIRDIVTIDGIDGMEQLNARQFLVEYINATTFSLKSLDGQADIDTTNYDAYSSGGAIYHSGFVLNTVTILANVNSKWTIKKILPDVTFDGFPTHPISESAIRNNQAWLDISSARRPAKTRQWQHMTTDSAVSYYLFWYPAADQAYNVGFNYQKEIPDISTWNSSTYPFHPADAHDAIWHGALAHLVGLDKRLQRSSEKTIATNLEVLFAKIWITKWELDKVRIKKLSRRMLSSSGGISSGLSA